MAAAIHKMAALPVGGQNKMAAPGGVREGPSASDVLRVNQKGGVGRAAALAANPNKARD